MATTLDDDLAGILARAQDSFDERAAVFRPSPALEDDERARRKRALIARGWPRRALRIASGQAYDEARAAGYLDALRERDGSGAARLVILAGAPGSGKTAACARWALNRPFAPAFFAPRFITAAAFFRSSRYPQHEGELSRDTILGEDVLVLDDLGVEFADAAGNYRVDLDELVNAFYSDDRTLIISTNILYPSAKWRDAIKAKGASVDESAPLFADRYGERILDRVRECGRWVDASTPSMRWRR